MYVIKFTHSFYTHNFQIRQYIYSFNNGLLRTHYRPHILSAILLINYQSKSNHAPVWTASILSLSRAYPSQNLLQASHHPTEENEILDL